MTRQINPRDLFQTVEFYNNDGIKVITRERYLALRELLKDQVVFELTDCCDLGVVYRERDGDEDTPSVYWSFWITGHKSEEEVHISFAIFCKTPHEALDCVVEQMKIDSEGEQQEAVEANI